MGKKICIALILLILFINFSLLNAQGWLRGGDSADDSDGTGISEGDESIDSGLGWGDDSDDDSSSSQQQDDDQTATTTQNYEYDSGDYEFTGRFYVALVLGFIVIVLVVLWIILLKKKVK